MVEERRSRRRASCPRVSSVDRGEAPSPVPAAGRQRIACAIVAHATGVLIAAGTSWARRGHSESGRATFSSIKSTARTQYGSDCGCWRPWLPRAWPFAPSARASARGCPGDWHPACIGTPRCGCAASESCSAWASPRRPARRAAGWTLVGWNDLGMHCMDDDYSVFSILPPYNIDPRAAHRPDGRPRARRRGHHASPTRPSPIRPARSTPTSSGKTNFWELRRRISSASRSRPTRGSPASTCRAQANAPQAMRFDADRAWWSAEGIPITPIDDAGQQQPLPADAPRGARRGRATLLATTDVVLPVSTRWTAARCHALGRGRGRAPRRGLGLRPRPGARLPPEHPAPPRRAARRPAAYAEQPRRGGLRPGGPLRHRDGAARASSARAATPRTRCPAPRATTPAR